jgi:hypothetical protein
LLKNFGRYWIAASLLAGAAVGAGAQSADAPALPVVRVASGASQLLVSGHPYLMLGGELGNSSAGTAAQADTILPRLAGLHFNTVLMPVAWDEIEPQEGRFDFSVLDHWVDVAQEQHVHLVLLWFGSWKNAFSNYAPEWVLTDTRRFPRAISAEGLPTEILSPLGAETARCDARAFAALMRHVREKDAAQQTVLMVQVENEIGYLGVGGRDRSEAANKLFTEAVPGELMARVKGGAGFATGLNPAGRNWKEVFGGAADEDFVAWEYGLFAQQVAAAGKKEYALPMYMNAQLPAEKETAGDYPSGGPYPTTQAIYRAVAPAIDFYAPDIYWPDFSGWVDEYAAAANPVFVPEARLDAAPMNAMYLYGEARGFGFSPFAVDSLPAADSQGKSEDKGPPRTGPGLGEVYGALSAMSDVILESQAKGAIRGLVLHENSLRPAQTVALGGFLFRATLARGWPARNLLTSDGGMMVLETAPDEFLVMGSGLTVTFSRDPDVDGQVAGIAGIERLAYVDGKWTPVEVENGDQSDQGRGLLMDAKAFGVYRVRLYTYSRKN